MKNNQFSPEASKKIIDDNSDKHSDNIEINKANSSVTDSESLMKSSQLSSTGSPEKVNLLENSRHAEAQIEKPEILPINHQTSLEIIDLKQSSSQSMSNPEQIPLTSNRKTKKIPIFQRMTFLKAAISVVLAFLGGYLLRSLQEYFKPIANCDNISDSSSKTNPRFGNHNNNDIFDDLQMPTMNFKNLTTKIRDNQVLFSAINSNSLYSSSSTSLQECLPPVPKIKFAWHAANFLNQAPLTEWIGDSKLKSKSKTRNQKRKSSFYNPPDINVYDHNKWQLGLNETANRGKLKYRVYYNWVNRYTTALMGFIHYDGIPPYIFYDSFMNHTLEHQWDFLTANLNIVDEGEQPKPNAPKNNVFRGHAGSRKKPELRYIVSDLPLFLPDTDKIVGKGTDFFKFDENNYNPVNSDLISRQGRIKSSAKNFQQDQTMSITIAQSIPKSFDFLIPVKNGKSKSKDGSESSSSEIKRTYDYNLVVIIAPGQNPKTDTLLYTYMLESTSFPVPETIVKLGVSITIPKLYKSYAKVSKEWQKSEELKKLQNAAKKNENNEQFQELTFRYGPDNIFEQVKNNKNITNIGDWMNSFDRHEIYDKKDLHCYDKEGGVQENYTYEVSMDTKKSDSTKSKTAEPNDPVKNNNNNNDAIIEGLNIFSSIVGGLSEGLDEVDSDKIGKTKNEHLLKKKNDIFQEYTDPQIKNLEQQKKKQDEQKSSQEEKVEDDYDYYSYTLD